MFFGIVLQLRFICYYFNCMMLKITFVIGVNGVGKTTTLAELQKILQNENCELYDFDERGVPENADRIWRISETDYWISRGMDNRSRNIATVIFGFVKPDEVEKSIGIILLDANKDTIENRIRGRYTTKESLDDLYRKTGKTLEKFIEGNVYVSSVLRERCLEIGCEIISTDEMLPEKIANNILTLLKNKNPRHNI